MDEGKIGLTQAELEIILNVFKNFPEIEKVIVFGSRALGNYKKTSDIDFCLQGKGLNDKTVTRIKIELEETILPYFFDVVNYDTINNADLKTHIDQYGVEITKSIKL
jgi:predicted nucleotidyltransferase